MDQPEQPHPERDLPKRWLDRHLWQIQPVRDILVIAAVFGFFWLGYKLSVVTVPLLLAITLAYVFEPLVKRMTRIEWVSRQGAAAAIIGLTVGVVVVPLVLGLTFAAIQGVQLASDLATQTAAIKTAVDRPDDEAAQSRVEGRIPEWIRDAILDAREREQREAEEAERRAQEALLAQQEESEAGGPAGEEPLAPRHVRRLPDDDFSETMQVVLSWVERNATAVSQRAVQTGSAAFDAFVRTVTSVVYIAFTLFLTAFFFFFISAGYGKFLEFSAKFIPEDHREFTLHLLRRFDEVVSGFIRGRLTIAFIQSIVFSVGYWIIGVPAPVLLGVAVALLSIVPYAALVGIPISIALLWLEERTGIRGNILWTLGAPVVFYFIGQALDDYVWTPLIQGKSTGMDTPTILFATLAGGALMGVYGLLLAIPLAACIKILLQEVFWPRFQDWIAGRREDFLPIDKA